MKQTLARPCEEAYCDEAGDAFWWAIEFDDMESLMKFVDQYESCTIWTDGGTNYIKLGDPFNG